MTTCPLFSVELLRSGGAGSSPSGVLVLLGAAALDDHAQRLVLAELVLLAELGRVLLEVLLDLLNLILQFLIKNLIIFFSLIVVFFLVIVFIFLL